MLPKQSKWIYYVVAGCLIFLYYAGSVTGLDFLAMLIILPVGFLVIKGFNPSKPGY